MIRGNRRSTGGHGDEIWRGLAQMMVGSERNGGRGRNPFRTGMFVFQNCSYIHPRQLLAETTGGDGRKRECGGKGRVRDIFLIGMIGCFKLYRRTRPNAGGMPCFRPLREHTQTTSTPTIHAYSPHTDQDRTRRARHEGDSLDTGFSNIHCIVKNSVGSRTRRVYNMGSAPTARRLQTQKKEDF